MEAIASQSTFSRFFGAFSQPACNLLQGLHRQAIYSLPSWREGYTLDLDSWSLLREDGHQEGVKVGYTRLGLKPCHRPLIAAPVEAKMAAGYWLRRGDSACVNGAAEFLRQTVRGLPSHIRIGLVRGDAGFGHESARGAAEAMGLKFILVARLAQDVKSLCRHDEAHWQPTEVAGIDVPEVAGDSPGRRLIIIRQRIAERPDAAGKTLIDVPGYRFQALLTNLPAGVSALQVWRRYNGRADIENRIKELNTLRWRLFSRAAVWSRRQGKPTLKLAVRDQENRNWWREILAKLTALPNCNAVGSLLA